MHLVGETQGRRRRGGGGEEERGDRLLKTKSQHHRMVGKNIACPRSSVFSRSGTAGEPRHRAFQPDEIIAQWAASPPRGVRVGGPSPDLASPR
eukprot:6651452-Pyramimonas_sp.AAC.1